MSFKALREQSKSKEAGKLARFIGKGAPSKDANADDAAPVVGKAAKKAPPFGGVEGKPAKPSLARPGRKIKRADGGRVSDDDDKEFQKVKGLKETAADDPPGLGNKNALLTGAGLATALHNLGRSKWPTPVRGLLGAAGLGMTYLGGKGVAEDAGKWSKAGQARKELREMGVDRKGGGRVKKK